MFVGINYIFGIDNVDRVVFRFIFFSGLGVLEFVGNFGYSVSFF